MKILHISQTNINYDSRILKELRALHENLPQITIRAIGAELENTSFRQESSFPVQDIQTVDLKIRKYSFIPRAIRQIGTVFELFVKMKRALGDYEPDIIHAHDTAALPIALFLKNKNTKIIYDAHELESDRNGLSKSMGKLVLLFEKMAWKKIDHLIVVGEQISNWYKVNIGKKDTTVILNSPYIGSFVTKELSYLRDKFNIKSDRKIFIYVGGLMPGRMINSYLKIFSQNNFPADLVLLGYGPLKAEILQYAMQHSNIHLHEAVSHDQVTSIVESADVGLCVISAESLSDELSLPNKLFEYAFSGIPSLVSRFPAMVEYSRRYKLGWVTNIDEESLCQSILEISAINELISPDKSALVELSWKQQEEKLVNVYRGLS